ncbi:transmembrane protein 65-like isoform X7 [Drosophila subpulchrella]|uniref:transmembrane protein 65-like isoform X7 n=1 Tax=Drosophila subpulchrella TaxID=1486046 RepID=UPI0018A14252|nr:transmembrane protein 65-like isoform X7 [Drosophila subpulchrella]
MRQQCKIAFRNLIHRCKSITTRPLCCGAGLLGKQQLILPLFTCTTSSPRNYSKFSTHITTERAMDLLCNLDEEERSNLRSALDKIDADKEKKLYEIESAAPPTAGQLYSIFFVNAVPFIAFGFLDNFIMIMAGEYIEYYLGHFITLSTMAAAGLGNTISDILGITMATYVENGCQILGLKQPKLTPAQFELKSSKRSSSYGRVVGITVGCLLGMCPLWFMEEKTNKEDVDD